MANQLIKTSASGGFTDVFSTLFSRRPFGRGAQDARHITELCHVLLGKNSETNGMQIAAAILNKYVTLNDAEKLAFFVFLNEKLDVDAAQIAEFAAVYSDDPSPQNFKALSTAAEPKRHELLRRLNQAPNATVELVRMRLDLLALIKTEPALARTDHDFVHLLRSWFNSGFLELRQITWDTPASILEKIIAYEAVHEIQNWLDLRRRLHPEDRRCFGFFHPAMPDEPLIFVEVALTDGVPGSIQNVLSDSRKILDQDQVDTAVFYSISNCQAGLAGISFGNSLIKKVARQLRNEISDLKTFVTLSPIPGLNRWLDSVQLGDASESGEKLKQFAARYLVDEKKPDGRPLDPVARFHLGNGAQVHAVHLDADTSTNGIKQSRGAMVNYLYDLSKIAQNVERLTQKNEVAASSNVKALARQGHKSASAIASEAAKAKG